MKFSEQVSQETPANAGFCNQLSLENVLTKIYFLKNISFDLIFNGMCSQGLSVQQTFEDLSLCLSWFVLGLFGSLLFLLYSSGQAATSQALSQLHIQLFFLNKFQAGGQRVVALERINVCETVGRKSNCKLNFFSIYFIRNNKQIHLPFKNSEKQWTQALMFGTNLK